MTDDTETRIQYLSGDVFWGKVLLSDGLVGVKFLSATMLEEKNVHPVGVV